MHLPFDNMRYSVFTHASSNVSYFFVADVNGLYEINKNNRSNAMLNVDRVRSKECSETEPKYHFDSRISDTVCPLTVLNLYHLLPELGHWNCHTCTDWVGMHR